MEPIQTVGVIGSVFVGLGLAASSGFRVFLPLLFLSLATKFGILNVGESWQWVSSTPAIAALGFATLVEILGFYVPWLDNLLDSIALPAAGIAGTMVMASTAVEIDPLWQWALAIIAGGGTAAAVKTGGASTRLVSSATTGGLANPIVATAETTGAIGLSLLSIFIWPLAAVITILLIIGSILFFIKVRKMLKKKNAIQ